MNTKQTGENTLVNEFLEKQFDRVNMWLSFAEAKNGALIAFNIAVIAAVVGLMKDVPVLCAACVILLIISTAIAFWSFVPNTGTDAKSVSELSDEDVEKLNLVFYGDISRLNYDQYKELLRKRYLNGSSLDRYQDDLCKEIHYNSGITMRKYCFFKLALKVELIAGVVMIALIIAA